MTQATHKQPRRDYRAEVMPGLVLDLSLWPAKAQSSASTIDPASLGTPLLQDQASRAYSLYLTNLSASGMGLHIHTTKLHSAKINSFTGRNFLIRLELDDAPDPQPLSLLLLAVARRAQPERGGAQVAFEFTAKTRYIKSARALHLFPLRGRGVDSLASWLGRSTTRPYEPVPSASGSAWYEALA